eukprot:3510126-Pyramimonas_sp.AAC.1
MAKLSHIGTRVSFSLGDAQQKLATQSGDFDAINVVVRSVDSYGEFVRVQLELDGDSSVTMAALTAAQRSVALGELKEFISASGLAAVALPEVTCTSDPLGLRMKADQAMLHLSVVTSTNDLGALCAFLHDELFKEGGYQKAPSKDDAFKTLSGLQRLVSDVLMALDPSSTRMRRLSSRRLDGSALS